ncbi:MAG TPA: glycosyltransferase family 4 protein [Nitrospiraceae bacterium]|nr:glycosyltransferase family 4 protein [Nitrospiraceae bacterium]
MKIICIEPVLAPYSISRFTAFQTLRSEDVIQVMALGATERMREWQVHKSNLGFEYAEAFPGETVENIEPRALAARVTSWLDEKDPQAVVITGYYYPAMRAAARWARQRGRASIFMGDSQWGDRRRIPLREWAKGWWVRRNYDAAFAAGGRTVEYLMRMGFLRERIWTGYDVVDNQAFAAGSALARVEAGLLRKRMGLPERYFLFVGRFAPEKNLVRLVEAYDMYRHTVGEQAWSLVLVGAGPQESMLRAQAEELRGVVFAGFQQVDAVHTYYGLASCLVLPSISETWGLVVNEAMAAGLPVLVSDRCGCVPELVQSGVNGYVCNPLDTGGMARLLRVMSSDTAEVARMGEASRQIVSLFTPETWAQTLADCIEQTLAWKQGNVEERALGRRSLGVWSQKQSAGSQVQD